MGRIRIMTPNDGDKTIEWDTEKESSVEKAKAEFQKLKDKGYKMFKTVKKTVTEKGEEVSEFDPSVGEYIAVPAMAGG